MLETVSNAQIDADVNAIKGMSGAVRKLTRRLGDAGPAFNAWLQILPTDTFGSAICGGFKILIDAATRHKDLCQEVFDALGEIPEVIKDADFSFSEYQSEELSKRVAKLYAVIMETLKRMLSFYQERASGRHIGAARNVFKAIVKGPNYGRTIEADIQRVKESASAVKQEADRCFHRRIGEMKNAQEFQTLQATHFQRLQTKGLNILQGVYAHLQYQHKCHIHYWRESQVYNLALRNEMTELKRAATPRRPSRNGPTLRKIGQLLNTSPSTADQDMEEVLREAQRFPVFLQTQANQFMTSQKLQDWLLSPYSRALLAQASEGDEKVSALSFVASLLVQSFRTSEDAIPLYFYCGLHTDPYNDSLAGATGGLRSIIAQLLRTERLDFDLGFIDHKHIQALEYGDLEALCDLFEGLTQQLPRSTVLLLVVDGISFYETRDRLGDTCCAMNRMLELVDKASFVFKLLITSPGQSAHVSKGFHHEQVYWLPEIDPEEDDEFHHTVSVFRNQAGVQVRTAQMRLMRSDSESMAID